MKLKDLLESQKDNNNIIKYEDKYYALAIENDSYTNKILNVEAFEIPYNNELFETFVGRIDFKGTEYIVTNTKTSEYVYFEGWENPSINLDTNVEPLDLKYITLEQYKALQQAHDITTDLTVAEYIKNNIHNINDVPKNYDKSIDDSVSSLPISYYITNTAKYVHRAYDYLKNNNINPIKSTDYIEEYENHLLEHYIETNSNIEFLEAFNNIKTNNNKVTYYKKATTLDIDDRNPFSIEECYGSTVVWYGNKDEDYMKISEFYDTIKDLKNTSDINEIYLIVQEKHLTKKFIDIANNIIDCYEDIIEAQNVENEIYNIATTEFDLVKTYLETALHTKEDIEKVLDYIYQDKNSTEITRI